MPKAHWFWPGKGLELQTAPLPDRQLAPHEVRVAVRAAALNYRDLLICRGEYPAPADRAVVPCSDGAGTVLEVGISATSDFEVGEAVVGSFFPYWRDGAASRDSTSVTVGCNMDGWLAEEIILPAVALAKIPAGMSFTTAACAPCAGVTAWVSLLERANLSRGQTVLVQGTGGVAMWMAKLAQARGLRTIFVTSDPCKVKQLEVDALDVISYREHAEWSKQVLRLTNGNGADLVLEVGGSSTITQSLHAVAFGGHIAIVGGLGGWVYEQVASLELLTKMVTVHGIYVGSKRSLEDLLGFVAGNNVSPHVSSIFSFNDARAAFAALEGRRSIGKILLDITS